MKKSILITLSFISIFRLFYSQQEKVIFKVTGYQINGENFDKLALEEDIALVFYKCDNETFCFANHFRKSNSQSYGGVYGFVKSSIPESNKKHAYDKFQFTWDFLNTYDNIEGKAKVTLNKIYIGSTVKMSAEIIVIDTNEILLFEGYLEEE